MNFDKDGEEIAILKKNNKKIKLYIAENENDPKNKSNEYFNNIELNHDEEFQIIQDRHQDRDTIFIAGMNGSGKSFYIKTYLNNFNEIYNYKKIIYLFSSKKEDKNLDDIKNLKRVKIDKTFVEDPLDYEELKYSMCIFDDIDAFTGDIKKAIYDLRDIILKNGRSYYIDCISTSHAPCGYDNKTPLNESKKIVFFLRNYNKTIRYFLENYVGLEKNQIQILRKNKTRATTYIKTYPNVIIQEKNAYIMTHL